MSGRGGYRGRGRGGPHGGTHGGRGGGRGSGYGGRGSGYGGHAGRQDADGGPHVAQYRGDRATLDQALRRIDGRPYGAFKELLGEWDLGPFTLHFDHVQGDSYAAPSRVRVRVKAPEIPEELYRSRIRRTALCDYLLRVLKNTVCMSRGDVKKQGHGWKGEKGGDMGIQEPGQFVLERSSVTIDPATGVVEARFTVGLPAAGRTCLGAFAADILLNNLPRYVQAALQWRSLDAKAVYDHVEVVEDTDSLRSQLEDHGLVAFVGNGAILPRKTGASQEPLDPSKAVPFQTPAAFAVELVRPNAGRIVGMGIPRGITLIVGGGFHGKSTLLEALQTGIYNKIPGDGRENVVVLPSTAKIRSEDGRAVHCVDVSPYIGNLPKLNDGNESEAGDFSEDEEERFAGSSTGSKAVATRPMVDIVRPDGTIYKPTQGRPVILFDLNGVLVHHVRRPADNGESWYHTHVLRPGLERLIHLKDHFDLGIYSSATFRTVQLAIASIELHLGIADRKNSLFDIVLHRSHCELARDVGFQRVGGNHWDTLKPLAKYFAGHPGGYVLVDDSSHKSWPGEASSMLVVPEWTQGNETCRVLDTLVEGFLGIHNQTRNFDQVVSDLRATFAGQASSELETRCFSTTNASGSTSQATNIQEALEQGCNVLLLDEDTSATNFMLRDARMQELISGNLEPITPLLHRIRALSTDRGVSTVVVVGGTGEYFGVCDRVIAMKQWRASDVTESAKAIAKKYGDVGQAGSADGVSTTSYPELKKRAYIATPSNARHKVTSIHAIDVDDERLDLSAVEQLVETGQTNAISLAIEAIAKRMKDVAAYRDKSFETALRMLDEEIDRVGLDVLGSNKHGSLSRPRLMEIACALNRYRNGRFVQMS